MRTALVLAFLGGCATAQPVPDPTVATIAGKGAVVDTIDARNVHDESAGARFEIPPGLHTVEVALPADALAKTEAKVIPVCFSAVAGHSYLTRPVFEQDRWRPEIIDEDSGELALAKCAAPAEAEAEPAPAEPAQAPAEQAPAGATAPPQVVSAPVSLPAPRKPAPAPLRDLPGTGLDVGVGFFIGGESLYTFSFVDAPDRKLSAGKGVLIALGGQWTPLWIEDKVGFGIGGDVGWKYDSVSAVNGSASFTRFPFNLTVHSLFPLTSRWYAQVSGGVAREVGHISGNGVANWVNGDFDSGWGLIAQGGFYYRVERVAFGGALRYTHMRATFDGHDVDASSVGLMGTGQYGF